MGQSQCPACSITAEMNRDAKIDVNHINCPSCGPYAVEGTFHRRIPEGQLSNREKEFVQYDMAAYIREEKPGTVGSPDTDPKAYKYHSKRKKQRQKP